METLTSPELELRTPTPVTVRAFFALLPPPDARAQLADLGRDIARRARGRSVAAMHAHLTLAFIGDVPEAAVANLLAIGDTLPHRGFTLEFGVLGAWRASGVAWIAPAVLPPALEALHTALGERLTAAGYAIEQRTFRPHLTLARRCLQPISRTTIAPIRWPALQLHLMGSTLTPDGPIYRELAAWPLVSEAT